MPQTTPTLQKRYVVAVPAQYWERGDGAMDGFGWQREVLAPTYREALEAAKPDLDLALRHTQEHFTTFEITVARCSRRNPARREARVYNVKRTGRIVGRNLYPYLV